MQILYHGLSSIISPLAQKDQISQFGIRIFYKLSFKAQSKVYLGLF
jgi:hypothetical protein